MPAHKKDKPPQQSGINVSAGGSLAIPSTPVAMSHSRGMATTTKGASQGMNSKASDATRGAQPSASTAMILEQERFLPIANISRIMKRPLPPGGKLAKEAKECMQECVTEFLLFITSEASERCSIERRKTISGEDIIQAFSTLGFDDYVQPLEDYLRKYREANRVHQHHNLQIKPDELPTMGLSNSLPVDTAAIPNERPIPTSSSPNQRASALSSHLSPVLEQNSFQQSEALHDGQLERDEPVSSLPTALDPTHHPSQPRPGIVGPAASNNASTPPHPTSLQSMPMYFDPATNNYYIAIQQPDGSQSLLQVTLSTTANIVPHSGEATSSLGSTSSKAAQQIPRPAEGEQTVRHYLESSNPEFMRQQKHRRIG